MAYLGNVPARSFISFERQVFTIVNSQTAYTLSHSVTNENDIRLVVNNVVQEPGSGKAYTASGTTLTLSAALTNGTDEMYCVFLGRAVGTVNAPAGSVTATQLVYPLTTFSSTGIDDNATSTAMTIDSSENIGIGTTSPASLGSNITTLEITGGSTIRTGAVYLSSSDKNIKGYFYGSNTGFNIGSETNADLKIVTNNTERVRIHSDGVMSAANGIALGVGTANTASNVLDDYEEGTWTPAYIGGSTAGTGVTGAGQYTKIGNLVHVDFGFVNVTASGAAGDLRISGLPFTVSNATTRGSFGGNVRFYNHQLSGNTYYQLTPVADGNTTYVVVTETRDHGTWTQVQVDNDSGLYIEGGITYVTTS